MKAWTFDSQGPEQTHAAGRALGQAIGADGLVIALIGPLGAGKTVFVKGLAEGLGVDPRVVSSPTFVIAQQYAVPAGPRCLHHIDLYRLESEHELDSIGFDEMFAPGAVLAAEWADRFPGALGRDFLSIEFEGPAATPRADPAEGAESGLPEASGPPIRRASVSARGDAPCAVLADWSARLDGQAPPRAGSGGFVEMRLGAWLCLCLLLWFGALAGRAEPPLASCESGGALESDALGTLRVACAAAEAGMGETTAAVEIEGIGRWLEGRRVDVNLAPRQLLESIPGIGPARARAIVEAREARDFADLADLERVRGIGSRTVELLSTWLEVGPVIGQGADPVERGVDRG